MMASKGQEIEVKFLLSDLPGLERRVKEKCARLEAPRVHEVNLRFDTPDRKLEHSEQVLRLRQDTRARMTYKGPGRDQEGAQLRQELEFTVSDFDMTRALFEALGYEVSVMYEKFRTTYDLRLVQVSLDEMPYGDFVEIEGPDGKTIQKAAQELSLDWEQRITDSYMVLLDRVRSNMGLTFRDLTFQNFQGIEVPASALGENIGD